MGILLDMAAKFYDHVDLSVLIDSALASRYPLLQLVMAIEAYAGPRMVRKWGFLSELIDVANSIIAGCVQATSLARGYLHSPVGSVVSMFPQSQVREFVGGLILKVWGTRGQVLDIGANGVLEFAQRLRRQTCAVALNAPPLQARTHSASSLPAHLPREAFHASWGGMAVAWALARPLAKGGSQLRPPREEARRSWATRLRILREASKVARRLCQPGHRGKAARGLEAPPRPGFRGPRHPRPPGTGSLAPARLPASIWPFGLGKAPGV